MFLPTVGTLDSFSVLHLQLSLVTMGYLSLSNEYYLVNCTVFKKPIDFSSGYMCVPIVYKFNGISNLYIPMLVCDSSYTIMNITENQVLLQFLVLSKFYLSHYFYGICYAATVQLCIIYIYMCVCLCFLIYAHIFS